MNQGPRRHSQTYRSARCFKRGVATGGGLFLHAGIRPNTREAR